MRKIDEFIHVIWLNFQFVILYQIKCVQVWLLIARNETRIRKCIRVYFNIWNFVSHLFTRVFTHFRICDLEIFIMHACITDINLYKIYFSHFRINSKKNSNLNSLFLDWCDNIYLCLIFLEYRFVNRFLRCGIILLND